jgi:hypothetical protein
MEYDRRNQEARKSENAPAIDSQGGKKDGESLTPPSQQTEMRKQIADRALVNSEKKDTAKESKDTNSINQQTEQQRNRDLWKK